MSRTHPIHVAGALLLTLLVATSLSCGSPGDLACEPNADETVPGEFTSGWSDAPVSADHTVTGTLSSDEFFVDLTVGTQFATFTSVTNFHAWTASLPLTYLRQIAHPPEEGDGCPDVPGAHCAELEVTAHDLCGNDRPVGDADGEALILRLPVQPFVPDDIPVVGLTIEVGMPDEDCFLPLDGSESAALVMRAAEDSAGATLELAATNGSLTGLDDENKVELGPVDGASEATAWVSSAADSTGGYARVTFQGTGVAEESVRVRLAAAPVFAPATASILVGETYRTAVSTEGRLGTCYAFGTQPDAVTVSVADTESDLLEEPYEFSEPATDDDPDDTRIDCGDTQVVFIDVLFSESAPDGSSVTIACDDTMGQVGQVTYSVAEDADP